MIENSNLFKKLILAFEYDQEFLGGKHTKDFLSAVNLERKIETNNISDESSSPLCEELDLPDRVLASFRVRNIVTVDDICKFSAKELLSFRNIGTVAIKNLEDELEKIGRELRKDD